jgi:hypothetical protein
MERRLAGLALPCADHGENQGARRENIWKTEQDRLLDHERCVHKKKCQCRANGKNIVLRTKFFCEWRAHAGRIHDHHWHVKISLTKIKWRGLWQTQLPKVGPRPSFVVLGIWTGFIGSARAQHKNMSPKHDPVRNNMSWANTVQKRIWVGPQIPAH